MHKPIYGCEPPKDECEDGQCDDSNACTDDSCDPATGCVNQEISCEDNNACTDDSCDPAAGCVNTVVNCDDNNDCTFDRCDPDEGCVHEQDGSCDDAIDCTDDRCDPALGCVSTPNDSHCDDQNICTDDSCVGTPDICDPNASVGCQHVFNAGNDPRCAADEVCRSAGFWSTHSADEDDAGAMGSITEILLVADGGDISICGETINKSDVGNDESPLEALCINSMDADMTNSHEKIKVARQLTAAVLNCLLNGATESCTGISAQSLIADCQAECTDGTGLRDLTECQTELDCFNNGGQYDPVEDFCQTGTCSDNGAACNNDDLDNCMMPDEADCTATTQNCHEADLPDDFDNNNIMSPDECNTARGNGINIFQDLP